MKIRLGFVSNSSSSSFLINKNCITEEIFNNLVKLCSTPNEFGDKAHIFEANSYYRVSQFLAIDKRITDYIESFTKDIEKAHGYLGHEPIFKEREKMII